MTSIFPSNEAGGLIVRDPDTGLPIEQPNVENADVPATLNMNCDYLALPSSCNARVAPEQINAIVSELINLFVAMAPGREWDCTQLDNLAEAFEQFVTELISEQVGDVSCSVSTGIAPDSAQAYLMYCDGTTLKRWSIHDEGGLVDFVLDLMCGVEAANITNDDMVLYCRAGVLQMGDYRYMNIYTGQWIQNRSYTTINMVQYNGKLYSPNAPIPVATPFVVGTSGATWYEVSQTLFPSFDPEQAYGKDAIINYQGKFWAANEDIPAGTPFVVGTSGTTWREITFGDCFILDHNPLKDYKKFQVVVKDGLLYRAIIDHGPGQVVPSRWELIGGERSRYRGAWSLGQSFVAGDLVEKDGRLYKANGNIAANTAFSIGPANFQEVSPSIGIEWNMTDTYEMDDIVSYMGNIYVANGSIPAGTVPATHIGGAGATWRVFGTQLLLRNFDPNKSYSFGELFAQATAAYPNERAIQRYKANGIPQAWWPTLADIVGERNKFRGRWNVNDEYLQGDIVLRYNDPDGDPYGTLYEANGNILAQGGWSVGPAASQWSRLASGGGGAGYPFTIYNQALAYKQNDLVLTEWGMYHAMADIPANTPFIDDPSMWYPHNSGRPQLITMSAAFNTMVTNHRNATIKFDFAGPKQYVITTSPLKPGDSVFGYSVNGQLTIAGAGGVTLRSPDGGSLRNRDYASFRIQCLSKSGNGSLAEYLLTGDLQVIP
jgi:hypothetical protein